MTTTGQVRPSTPDDLDAVADAPAAAVTAVGVLAPLVLLGVLLQPVFAGAFLGDLGAWGLSAHEIGANATFGLVLVEALVVLATPLRRHRRLLVGLVVIGVTLTAIIGLGYVGGAALVVHVPLAVVVAIGATHHVTTARGLSAGG